MKKILLIFFGMIFLLGIINFSSAQWNPSLTANMSLYWGCNEGIGTLVTDNYAGLYNGTLVGTWVNSTNGAFYINSANFSGGGTGNGLNAISNGATNFTKTMPFTVNLWVKVYGYTDGAIWSTLNGSQSIGTGVSLYSSSSSRKFIFTMQDNFPNGFCITGSDIDYVNFNIWQMLTVVYDGSGLNTGLKYYINGTLKSIMYCAGWSQTLNSYWYSSGNFSLMDKIVAGTTAGSVDEVSVWKNRNLSDSEISQLYNNGTGIFYGTFDIFPSISLNAPNDKSNFSNIQTLGFNVSSIDDFNLSNLSIYINGVRNITIYPNSTSAYINQTITFGEGSYNWSAVAVDNSSQVTWSANRTFNVYLNPAVTINSPLSTISSSNISININASDIFGISYCSYNITLGNSGGVIEKATTSINLVNFTEPDILGFPISSTFFLTVFCNNTNNNVNITTMTFTSPVTPPSGGGGGGTTIINNNNQNQTIIPPLQPKCQKFSDAYDKWLIDTQNNGIIDRIKTGWRPILNLAICKGDASIAPIDYVP